MTQYLLIMYVSLEQETAIRHLYTQHGWMFEKSEKYLREIGQADGNHVDTSEGQESQATETSFQSISQTGHKIPASINNEFTTEIHNPPVFQPAEDKVNYPYNDYTSINDGNSTVTEFASSDYKLKTYCRQKVENNASRSNQSQINISSANGKDSKLETIECTVDGKMVPSGTPASFILTSTDIECVENNCNNQMEKDHSCEVLYPVKVECTNNYDAETDTENNLLKDNTEGTVATKKKLTSMKTKTKKKAQMKGKRAARKVKSLKSQEDAVAEAVFCVDCKRNFTTLYRYELHLKKNNGKCYFECEFCDKVFFYKKSRLLVHIRSAHTKERPFTCDKCGKGYVTLDKLKIHARVHTGEKPCVCDQCGRAFYSLGQLSMHNNYHHVWKQQPHRFMCEECNTSFCSQNYLNYHLKVFHCKTRDFHCTQCTKSFKSADGLKYHVKFTHADKRAYKCDHCEKSFKAPAGLRRHRARHHTTTVEKRFACTICDKAFVEKDKLKMHMNVHTGAKPYQCNQCDFKCAFSGNLSKHKKTHTKDKKGKLDMLIDPGELRLPINVINPTLESQAIN